MTPTSIEWVQNKDGSRGETWNPIAGCSKISPGCQNCYALKMSHRIASIEKHPTRYNGVVEDGEWTGRINVDWEEIDAPLRWRKPRRVFVCSMSDLFHEGVPSMAIDEMFGVMALAQKHTFQVLTKRSRCMAEWFENLPENPVSWLRGSLALRWGLWDERLRGFPDQWTWPLPNVWMMVTVESQNQTHRLNRLLSVPAAIHGVSIEPMLDLVDLTRVSDAGAVNNALTGERTMAPYAYANGGQCLDWVIIGGESGPNARPMREEWVRYVLSQCREANVPAFVKQMGTVWAREHGLRGKASDPSEWPEDLRIREWPR